MVLLTGYICYMYNQLHRGNLEVNMASCMKSFIECTKQSATSAQEFLIFIHALFQGVPLVFKTTDAQRQTAIQIITSATEVAK